MRRRDFLVTLGAATWPHQAEAQGAGKIYRVGVLSPGPPEPPDAASGGRGAALVRALEGHGYKLGQNLVFESRGAMGRLDRLPSLAQELAAAKVDVVVTVG